MTRVIVILPPLALLLAGLAMLVVAPFAWGADANIGFADALPTVVAVIYAVPAIFIGGLSTYVVLKNTKGGFSTSWLVSPLCALAYVTATVVEVALCFRVANPATYNALLDSSGKLTVTQSGLLVSSIAPTIVMAGLVSVFAYAYCQMITPEGTKRFDRRPDEPDMMEVLSRHRDV